MNSFTAHTSYTFLVCEPERVSTNIHLFILTLPSLVGYGFRTNDITINSQVIQRCKIVIM